MKVKVSTANYVQPLLCTLEDAKAVAASIPDGLVAPYPTGAVVELKQIPLPVGWIPDPTGRLALWVFEWTEVVPMGDGSTNNAEATRQQTCAALLVQLREAPLSRWQYDRTNGTFTRNQLA